MAFLYPVGAAFIALTGAVFFAPRRVQQFDDAIEKRLRFFATPAWSRAFIPITALGSVWGIILVALLSAALFQFTVLIVLRLSAALIGSTIVAQGMKRAAARVRPREHPWLPPFPEYSYPSGHATAAMTLYGFLLVTFYPSLAVALLCAVIIAAVGLSRLALSAHFLIDIIGGYLLGAFCIALAFQLPFIYT